MRLFIIIVLISYVKSQSWPNPAIIGQQIAGNVTNGISQGTNAVNSTVSQAVNSAVAILPVINSTVNPVQNTADAVQSTVINAQNAGQNVINVVQSTIQTAGTAPIQGNASATNAGNQAFVAAANFANGTQTVVNSIINSFNPNTIIPNNPFSPKNQFRHILNESLDAF